MRPESTQASDVTDSMISSYPPATKLKRVNTPPSLRLSNFMSGDASIPAAARQHHRRSQSAIGKPPTEEDSHVSDRTETCVTRPATSASAISALRLDTEFVRSPCFVHTALGAGLNLERVLDECRAEEMTHHNLLQTATGVREVARQLGIVFRDAGLTCNRSYGD
jgi:hypothetical protein